MRSSDLFTTIAEKSRPTATTHSRSRTEPSVQTQTAQTRPRDRSPRGETAEGDRTAHVAPRSGHVARFVARRSAPGMPVRLPLPSTRIGEGDGEASRSPAPRSQLAPGTAYRDPTPRRDAIRRRIGFREFEGSRTCGSRRSRTRYTRHATHGHPPKSASRPFEAGFEALSCSWSAGSASRACQGGMPNAECAAASVYTAYQNVYVIQYKFRLHRVHARRVIHVATAATRGSTIPPRRRFARHIKDTPILTESAMCTGMGYGVV